MPHGGVTRGPKWAKLRSRCGWLKKIRKMKNINFAPRISLTMIFSTKKLELFWNIDKKTPKCSLGGSCDYIGPNHSTSLAYSSKTVTARRMRLVSFERSFKKL